MFKLLIDLIDDFTIDLLKFWFGNQIQKLAFIVSESELLPSYIKVVHNITELLDHALDNVLDCSERFDRIFGNFSFELDHCIQDCL